MGKRLSLQQKVKRIEKSCRICNESNYNVLDSHRIQYGSNGGKYTLHNTICLCAACHRRVHAGEIIIDDKYQSTAGEVLHYFIDGVEFWN